MQQEVNWFLQPQTWYIQVIARVSLAVWTAQTEISSLIRLVTSRSGKNCHHISCEWEEVSSWDFDQDKSLVSSHLGQPKQFPAGRVFSLVFLFQKLKLWKVVLPYQTWNIFDFHYILGEGSRFPLLQWNFWSGRTESNFQQTRCRNFYTFFHTFAIFNAEHLDLKLLQVTNFKSKKVNSYPSLPNPKKFMIGFSLAFKI